MKNSKEERFLKKPVEVSAFKVTQDYLDSIRDPKRFEPEECNYNHGVSCVSITKMYTETIGVLSFNIWKDRVKMYVNTLEGRMDVSVGDWIITGVKGEKYPCKPDIFEMTYEKIV